MARTATDSTVANQYDVIVVGAGAMGSAATYHLASRGARVLAIDRYAPPHAFGSSHGKSRIIREAYFEHPLYVPLLQRAYVLWANLEREAGVPLLTLTGGLMLGARGSVVTTGALLSATQHDLPHKVLSADELTERYPPLRPAPGTIGIWEPRAGVLDPDACIRAHLDLASSAGATVQPYEAVLDWRTDGERVRVSTTNAEYTARTLVLSAGAWLSQLVLDLTLPLTIARQVLFWFQPVRDAEQLGARNFPIFIWEHARDQVWYGFPDLGDGVKVAVHHEGESAEPDTLRRTVSDDEVDQVRVLLDAYIPAANGPLLDTAVCMYTNTPDFHFIIDRHPHHSQVLIASPCSGHGFKFSSVIGEQLAALALDEQPTLDLSPFALARFA
jgi:sarcosine oxidase